jgi:RNA recognition motif-containing protein
MVSPKLFLRKASNPYLPRLSQGVSNMAINIYVGNLAYRMSESELRELFTPYGEPEEVKIITDRDTGRSKGFGFVRLSDRNQGRTAIEALNGQDVKGRRIKVGEARPRRDSRPVGLRSGRGPGYSGQDQSRRD